MARKSSKTNQPAASIAANGKKLCPVCKAEGRGNAELVPMSSGKGFRCGVVGNKWSQARGAWSKCNYTEWNNTKPFFTQKKIERPADFPSIAVPTQEQKAIYAAVSLNPQVRGSRCLIIDAGPGTGKTTSLAWASRGIYQRVGWEVRDWHTCAFNVNARETFEKKLPPSWPNVSTINGFGGRQQGFNFRQYKTNKVREIFKDLTTHLDKDERPALGGVGKFVERMRDLLLFNRDEGDHKWWGQAIEAIAARFPALAKYLQKPESAKVIKEYVPAVMTRSLADRKVIDLSEQYSRPALEAVARHNLFMPFELVERSHDWTEADLAFLADIIRRIQFPQVRGVIVDEAQDLSLSQICLYLAATWRSGELILIGDDRAEKEDGSLIKAGQAIFGWRGAFPGSLTLIARLWRVLTGEEADRTCTLSVTHRCPPEVVTAVHSLNTVLRSSKPQGSGAAWTVSSDTAWNRWLSLEEGKTALWICRRNAPLSDFFIGTIKEYKDVCLRGGKDFTGTIDGLLYEVCGWYDDAGEYKMSLDECIDALAGQQEPDEGKGGEESLAGFLLQVAQEIKDEPTILAQADLPANPTVGNLRRFITSFADKASNRVLTTVYRAKGDEADLTIVSDCEHFNTPWNGDEAEAAACRHVAATRAKEELLVTGSLSGVSPAAAPADSDE